MGAGTPLQGEQYHQSSQVQSWCDSEIQRRNDQDECAGQAADRGCRDSARIGDDVVLHGPGWRRPLENRLAPGGVSVAVVQMVDLLVNLLVEILGVVREPGADV